MLKSIEAPLIKTHDLVMFDLDGVIYVSGQAIPGVAEALERTRSAGLHIAFITNNAARTPDKVAANLVKLGVRAEAADVVTSAQAAARLVKDTFGDDARVLLLGGPGLVAALEEQGLAITAEAEEADAVVSGYGPDVLWKDIMRAAALIRSGTPYVASNADLTIPTAYGTAPGHGVLVQTIAAFAGVEPLVAGKPAPPLMEETVRRVGGDRPLMVGDRLDTDIEGARAIGVDSLLVLTGVTGLAELVAAEPRLRPSYLSCTLAGLFEAHPAVEPAADGSVSLAGWTVLASKGRLVVEGEGRDDDWWRAVAVAAWAHLDTAGDVVDITGVEPPGGHHPEHAAE